MPSDPAFSIEAPDTWKDYALLDTGDGRKLEQVGAYRIVRPEARARWAPALRSDAWDKAVAEYRGPDDEKKGTWVHHGDIPASWEMLYGPVKFTARLTSFRHLGFFPEQAPLWEWMVQKLKEESGKRKVKVLNLFAYTGIATLLMAEAGAEVTHVDASKQSTAWARENQKLSKLEDKPVRWIVDDALSFVKREARRGNTYDAIVMDPPKFGRGPKGEVWKAEESLKELLEACGAILSPDPLFAVVTVYTIPLPATALAYAVGDMFSGKGGTVSCGELANREQGRGRLIPTAVFARWSR
jgi:23S rRNA (cytosine1962-C5)-methyltransferase